MNTLLWWLGQNTLTVAMMIPVVLLFIRGLRHRPAVQHLLWVVVLLKIVTPPLIVWPWTLQQVRDSMWPAAVASHDSITEAAALPTILPGEVVTEYASFTDATSSPATSSSSRISRTVHAILGSESFGFSLGMTWLLGALACLAWQWRRISRQSSLVRRGRAASEILVVELQAVASQLGLRAPRALISRDILSPFVWCLGRLRLVWPESLSTQSAIARSRGALAHELAHVRRGDHWVSWLELAAGIVWWWNPLYWFVRRRLREAAEMACDALAIGTDPESRREYAELLLELSAGFKTGMPAPVLAVSAGTPASFERRLSMILSDRVSGNASWWGFCLALTMGLLTLPGWSLGQQQLTEDPSAERPTATTDPLPEPPVPEVTNSPIEPSPQPAILSDPDKDLDFVYYRLSQLSDSSPAEDSELRDLIEKGQFEEAKARLESLRKKQADERKKAEQTFSEHWRVIFSKELPQDCLKEVPENSALSWKTCLKCHQNALEAEAAKPNPKAPSTYGAWIKRLLLSSPVQVPDGGTSPKGDNDLVIDVKSGKLMHPQIPFPLEDVHGKIYIDAAQVAAPGAVTWSNLFEARRDPRVRPILGFKGQQRNYRVIFEGDFARLIAMTVDQGHRLWQTEIGEVSPPRKEQDRWSLNESADHKLVVLTWNREDDVIQLTLDAATGKVVNKLTLAHTNPDTRISAAEVRHANRKWVFSEMESVLKKARGLQSDSEAIAALYQGIISRPPTKLEADFAAKFLSSKRDDREKALADIAFLLSQSDEAKAREIPKVIR